MWTKILKVLMWIYFIVAVVASFAIGSEEDSVFVGLLIFVILILLGSFIGAISEIADNVLKMRKDISTIKDRYVGTSTTYNNSNTTGNVTYSNQTTEMQYSNMQYTQPQYDNGGYINNNN